MKLLIVSLVIVSGSLIVGQRIIERPCPAPERRPVVENFDLERYISGKWYEISRYDQYFERGCDCGFATYSMSSDGSVKVENCCERLPNTTVHCSVGKAVLSFPDRSPLVGKFNVTFGGPPNDSNYWIMDTDYDNYAIIYSCKNLSEQKSAEAAWVLSKQRFLDSESETVVDKLLDQHLYRPDMRITEQSQEKCKYKKNGDKQI